MKDQQYFWLIKMKKTRKVSILFWIKAKLQKLH